MGYKWTKKLPPPLRKLYLAENIWQFGVKIRKTVFDCLSYDLTKLKNILFCGTMMCKERSKIFCSMEFWVAKVVQICLMSICKLSKEVGNIYYQQRAFEIFE